jgi:formylglycine-generating enzyme required for sulfatase activity
MATLLLLVLILLAGGPALEAQDDVKAPEGMIYVPGGKFLMGSDVEEGQKPTEESPRHEVVVKPFFISLYEVTNREYARFIEAKGYEKKEYWSEEGRAWLAKANRKLPVDWEKLTKSLGETFPSHPAVGASWFEADAFARYSGKRLLTEAEWERAARGTDGRKFPWGNRFETGVRKKPSGEAGPTYPVGANPADVSPAGAYDMGGNVAEWTSSWLEPYPGTKYPGRNWGKRKVPRGGCWRFMNLSKPVEHKSRVTYRGLFQYPHTHGYTFIGIRLAKDVPTKKPEEKPEKKPAK